MFSREVKLGRKIFIVDDDESFGRMLSLGLDHLDSDFSLFQESSLFLKEISNTNNKSIIILDLCMPHMDGVEVIRHLAMNQMEHNLILISGLDSGVLKAVKDLASAHGIQVLGTLTKPFSVSEIESILRSESQQSSTRTPTSNKTKYVNENSILEAFDSQQFIAFYQPQVKLETLKPVGFEALVRWRTSNGRFIAPNEFLSLVSNMGLSSKITETMLRQTLKTLLATQEVNQDLVASVNITPDEIENISLPELISNLLTKYGISSQNLRLELTENGVMKKLTQSLDSLTRLKIQGIELSIDDFGTGYSSMSLLHKIPFSELKIDRRFVKCLTTDSDCRAIVETCIMLGHKLNMSVIAEGVEDLATHNALVELGCDFGQGFYYAKPMDEDSLIYWLNKRSI